MSEKINRDSFTDDEWKLYQEGRCCWLTAYGLPWSKRCGKPIDPTHGVYCTEHAHRA